MTSPTIHDVEPRLDATTPEFMAWMRDKAVWGLGEALRGALMTGLLEGWWPRTQQRMMGPRTRALWDQMRP